MIAIGFIGLRLAREADGATGLPLVENIAAHNVIYLFADFVVLSKIVAIDRTCQASRLELALAGISCLGLLTIAPIDNSFVDGIAALVLGGALFLALPRLRDARSAAIIFLTLFFNLVIARLMFVALQAQIITADAMLTAGFLKLSGHDVIRTANGIAATEEHSIAVIGACSSFNNASLALLAAVAAIVFVRDRLEIRDVGAILLVILVMILANTARLTIFALSYDAYLFWHGGDGAFLLTIVQTLLVGGSAYWVATRGNRRVSS